MVTFATKYPLLTQIIMITIDVIKMFIPWMTFIILIIIAISNSKNLINLVLLSFTLMMLLWHISANLVTKKSHDRLIRGWQVFTLVSSFIFA